MEKQVVVIDFVGERPSDEVMGSAIMSFLTTIKESGSYIDATVDPHGRHYSENEVAKVVASHFEKAKGGIIVKVKSPERPKIVITKDKGEKLQEFIERLING